MLEGDLILLLRLYNTLSMEVSVMSECSLEQIALKLTELERNKPAPGNGQKEAIAIYEDYCRRVYLATKNAQNEQ